MKRSASTLGMSMLISLPLMAGECTREAEPPAIPDGSAASKEEMIAAQGQIKAYMADVNAFLECRDGELKALEAEVAAGNATVETLTAEQNAYNVVYDEMNGVATGFNEAIRAYKAQSQ